jgi:hypothetical protein
MNSSVNIIAPRPARSGRRGEFHREGAEEFYREGAEEFHGETAPTRGSALAELPDAWKLPVIR